MGLNLTVMTVLYICCMASHTRTRFIVKFLRVFRVLDLFFLREAVLYIVYTFTFVHFIVQASITNI